MGEIDYLAPPFLAHTYAVHGRGDLVGKRPISYLAYPLILGTRTVPFMPPTHH